jgi:GNAT superfamily N-acetyltransferase
VDVVSIERSDPLYTAARRLRWEVLRRPLGMPPGSEENPREAACRHLVAVEGGSVIACLIFDPCEPEAGRLMQMAVDPTWQRQGVGRRLVQALEQAAREEGRCRIWLHARESALVFYERLGYRAVGPVFTEVGLRHRRLEKTLAGPGGTRCSPGEE